MVLSEIDGAGGGPRANGGRAVAPRGQDSWGTSLFAWWLRTTEQVYFLPLREEHRVVSTGEEAQGCRGGDRPQRRCSTLGCCGREGVAGFQARESLCEGALRQVRAAYCRSMRLPLTGGIDSRGGGGGRQYLMGGRGGCGYSKGLALDGLDCACLVAPCGVATRVRRTADSHRAATPFSSKR